MEENVVMEEVSEEMNVEENSTEEAAAKQQHYYYAQIGENNICVGVSDLSGEVTADNMIRLDTYDMNVMGKKYENGTWVEVEKPEPEQPEEAEPQPTNAEIKSLLLEVQEQNLILMEALADMYEAGSN